MFFAIVGIGLHSLWTIVAEVLNATQHNALLSVYVDAGEWGER